MRSFFFLPALFLTTLAPACCGIGTGGNPIQFGKQENIVIYDSKTQTEIFIRNARFHTAEPDFAFIAPTPSIPKIYEGDSKVFKYIYSKDPHRTSTGSSNAALASSVEVLQVTKVGGYKATTLKSTDAKALKQYLESHNYKTTPNTEKWLKKYIDQNWYLTAFQVESLEEIAATGVIAMEFQTDRPFNPYYVPEENHSPGTASLEFTFISDQYCHPEFPNREEQPKSQWESTLIREDLDQISRYLKPEGNHRPQLPERAYILKYMDYNFPNKAHDDIYFTPRPIPFSLKFSEVSDNVVSGIEPESGISSAISIVGGSLVIVTIGTILLRRKLKS